MARSPTSSVANHAPAVVDALVCSLYDALLDPDGFAPWFDALAARLGASAAGFTIDRFDPDASELAWRGLTDECVRDYGARYFAMDPWRAANQRAPVGVPRRSDQLVDRSRFERSEFGGGFCRAHRVVDFFDVVLERSERRRFVLGATFDRAPSDERAVFDALSILGPHARRALLLRERQLAAERRSAALERAIDGQQCGLLLLDARGSVRFESAEAARCVRAGDGLALGPRGALVPEAVAREGLAALRAGRPTALRVERPSGAAPYVLVFAPAGATASSMADEVYAAVHVIDPSRASRDTATLLRATFGLTRAEAKIAVAVADGASVREASESLGVAYSTARTQLLAVYAKTGAGRQSALARLLRSLELAPHS